MKISGFVERKTKRIKLGQTTVPLFGDIKPIETAVAGRIFTEYSYEVDIRLTATWGAGPVPECPNWGITQNFIERMRVLIDSKQVVNISPVMALTLSNISKGSLLESGSLSSAIGYPLVKDSSNRLKFDTSGFIVDAAETIVLNRSQPYCGFQEGVRTADDFRKYDNIQFYFDRKSIEQLRADGDAAAAFAVTGLEMTITVYAEQLLDIQSVDKVQLFSLELIENSQVWKAASSVEVVNLNRTAMLSNLYYKAFSGGAGLPADDMTFDKVRLLKNGEDEILLDTTHLDLQRAMLDSFSIYAPWSTVDATRFLEGVGMICNVRDSLSQAHDNTKLINGQPTKTFELELTSTATADVTKPAQVRVVQERLIAPL